MLDKIRRMLVFFFLDELTTLRHKGKGKGVGKGKIKLTALTLLKGPNLSFFF